LSAEGEVSYYIKTAFQPGFELEGAKRVCRELDLPLFENDVMLEPETHKEEKY
jgi:hypothetical protein